MLNVNAIMRLPGVFVKIKMTDFPEPPAIAVKRYQE
jgi:hypothetical protein